MRKTIKILFLLMAAILLVACGESVASDEFEYTALEEMERGDGPVSIPEDTSFLTMSQEAKEQIYESLDAIGTHSQGSEVPEDYSNIEEIDSEQAYIDWATATNDTPAIIYLGFDECPWCKAFSPKINQFASEHGVEIAYYNTRAREQDLTFRGAMESYGAETVPHVYIVSEAEAQETINHHTSMAQMEAFFDLYINEYLAE